MANDPLEETTTGANSLTITHGDFSNVIHEDNDSSPMTYGVWWLAERLDGGGFKIAEQGNSAVKHGAFVIPKFGVGADFSG